MRRAQAKTTLNCRVHKEAELAAHHYLLVSSCRLHLRQPRAPKPKPTCGYDFGLRHDIEMHQNYADISSKASRDLHGIVSMLNVKGWTIHLKPYKLMAAMQVGAAALCRCLAAQAGQASRAVDV